MSAENGRERKARPRPHVDPDVEEQRLRDACDLYHERHEFTIGDLVCMKRGIQIASRRAPGSEPVFVVMDVFPDAEVCTDYANMSHYGIRDDVYLGFYDEDDDFVFMPFDSRRLEPWPRSSD